MLLPDLRTGVQKIHAELLVQESLRKVFGSGTSNMSAAPANGPICSVCVSVQIGKQVRCDVSFNNKVPGTPIPLASIEVNADATTVLPRKMPC